jgi:hypothetical protein
VITNIISITNIIFTWVHNTNTEKYHALSSCGDWWWILFFLPRSKFSLYSWNCPLVILSVSKSWYLVLYSYIQISGNIFI